MVDDLACILCALIDSNCLARCRIQRGKRAAVAQCDKDAIFHGYQPAMDESRVPPAQVHRLLWRPCLPTPIGHRAFPQQDAAERVPGHQSPFVGQPAANTGRPLVQDVEQATFRRDHPRQGGALFMRA